MSAVLSRRQFVQASALAGGGLLLQVALPRAAQAMTMTPGSAAGSLNAFVRIEPSGRIVLIMPKVEMGQGTYTSLPMLIAEELEVDIGAVSVEPAPPAPDVYGVEGDQSTGGSTSIRDCWVPLRTAGAMARQMLLTAAAQSWKVAVGECHAQNGAVLHAGSGRRLSYGELASRAAALPAPTAPPLKSAAQFKLIGRSHARLDSPAKIRGAATYGIDVKVPGAKVAMLAMSPVMGGQVKRPLNEQAALAVPGVRRVVEDGDIVAVVADHTGAARAGLAALAPQWQDGANGGVQQADLIHALEQASLQPGAVAAQRGKIEPALQQAATRLDAVYHQPFLAHATMEPMNCTVHWRPDHCEIWVGTQAPDRAVAKLAALGLKPEQITIHNHLIGGGFGRRLEVDGIVIAARIARHVKEPVKVIWSREEDIQHDNYRPYYVDRLQAGLDAKGTPIAWRHTIAGSAVSALWSGEPLKNGVDDDAVEAAADPVYGFANFETRFVRCEPQGVSTSWWRGVGPTRSVFVVESFIDELAAAAKQDPVAYRRALIGAPRMRAALDLAADRAGWGQALPAGRARGVSVQFAFGSYLAQVVEVSVKADQVQVHRVVCAIDCGQMINPDTIEAQLQGGVIFGLGAVLYGEITFANGRVRQNNFNDYQALRLSQSPQVEVHLIRNHEAPGGIGETGTACIAAAVCNGIFAATGRRIRTLPISRGLKS